ncbi:MAG: hypothetical protein KZQ66_20195, partial [Candidatus Thiodiazotropha sp. (ex Lucinoma aequizonata)]|nr:hypothetical protein [Candidatus Thiodiazotropha sp. (ex Lucinoma aequizonata)]MCU7895059.1 hypothetical protein [Candidatus Thiodiazotropha sp. (ex Lucinoma aequizonata)]MCU7897244.1 hypothetical protein [Candidatus Thiodiazotropha sp. (ex Lucinoma aequizonata)]MCU7904011.1 hypothetical protein [Candidatus Thiodiazotropha sp. (ex Lucinoma aequizonata)]MCU7908394.1 hypothetical protein [Candidatus Thiodiazotropha sp. (ex Lucinoma aequizonata)]
MMYNDSRSRESLTILKKVAPEGSSVLSANSSLVKLLYLRQSLSSARQKTHFFREPVLPRLVISGLIINTGA